jgi:hypothetical protein
MNGRTEPNFSDEAVSGMLATPTNDSADAEVVALKAALRSYRTETLSWAERRSATQPSLAAKARESRWSAVPQWSLACVAIVAVAAGVVHFAGYGAEDATPASDMSVTTTATRFASQDDIAADNRLLGSIDQALRYRSVSPTDEFQAKPAKQASRNTHTGVTD